MRRFSLGLCCVIIASCSGQPKRDGTPTIDTGGIDANAADMSGADTTSEDAATTMLPNRCMGGGGGWSPGTAAFRDASSDVGLVAINPTGVRISAVDFDGDGYADLFIRRTGATGDDFDGDRTTWLLRNTGEGTFEDVTEASGLVRARYAPSANLGRPAEVVAFADVDNDGDLDAVTAFSNDGTNAEGAELMLNDGDGTFSFGSLVAPFRREGVATSVGGLTWVDVDRDGQVDLWVGQGATGGVPLGDLLFAQAEDGSFTDVTSARGLQTADWTREALNAGLAHSNAWSSAACDLNGDGNPELLAASYGRAPNKLFLGDANGDFTDHSVASGYAFDDRTDWTDNESARCWCTLNPTDADCAGVPAPNIRCETNADAFRWSHGSDRDPFRLGGNSGTTVCGDVNNDGHLDLLTTEIVHWDVGSSSDPSELLINDGAANFTRPGNDATGLTRTEPGPTWDRGDITGALFDFDNDGRLDVLINSTDYPGTRAHLYHQQPDGTFVRVSLGDGIDHQSSHGVGIADFDRDGDLDIVLGHSRNRCSSGSHCYDAAHVRYFENTVGQDANWVQLSLEGGEGTNRAAIGARITVTTDELTQTHEIGGGHGHYGIQHDLVAHFGLAASCRATVTVRWPDAELSEETFEVQAGYRYDIRQGEPPVAQRDE